MIPSSVGGAPDVGQSHAGVEPVEDDQWQGDVA